MHEALIVAGPTASGKSALALDLAQALGGAVVNADSMQVYRELRVLTARPTLDDEARVPHALYGVRAAAEPGSVGWWQGEALAAMGAARARGRLPILCGGTGLYLSALVDGLADIPPVGDDARSQARALLAEQGAPGLHARLAEADPDTAARLRPSDGQRVARAWEVLVGTGLGLAAWQARAAPKAPWRFRAVVLDPPREALRDAIGRRFGAMLRAGALDEVRALLALDPDPSWPVMRALGVPELAAHLRGALTLDEARSRAALATGRYTKRQATWFRNKAIAPPERTHSIHASGAGFAQLSDSSRADLMRFVRGAVDA